MKPVQDTHMAADPCRPRALIPATAREILVTGVYAAVDEAAGRELARLKREEGIVPSCRRGCSGCCCGQHIQTNSLEAHALAQFIKRTFSQRQVDALRQRTLQWHLVDEVRRGRPELTMIHEEDPPDEAPCCPMLVEGACSAYPARPVICRTHFVSSNPSACRPPNRRLPAGDAPVTLTSIIEATSPLANALRAGIETTGRDYSRSIMLLPHWLAIEMGWDFAERP
jgi:Fe-S-cluster containining protein